MAAGGKKGNSTQSGVWMFFSKVSSDNGSDDDEAIDNSSGTAIKRPRTDSH